MKRLAILTSALATAAKAPAVVNVCNRSDYVADDTISNLKAQNRARLFTPFAPGNLFLLRRRLLA